MSQNGSGLGGMRIVTVTVIARAGEPEWSDLKSEVDVNAEPGWPQEVVLAASLGALKGALKAVEEAQEKHNEAQRTARTRPMKPGPGWASGQAGQGEPE